MKVVNPIGRKADNMDQVEKAPCRCESSQVFASAKISSSSHCACRTNYTTDQAVKNG